MPWDLPEFDRRRLEKARRLLEESEEHRGCRDLQLYVEGTDLNVQLNGFWLDDTGERRQGLTEKEKLQGLVIFVQLILRKQATSRIRVFSMPRECGLAVIEAAAELHQSPLVWGNLLLTISVAGLASLEVVDLPADSFWGTVERASSMTSQPQISALAAAFELHQRSEGFNPVLNAADIRLVALYFQQEAAKTLLHRQPEAPAAQHWLAAGLSANRELLRLDPSAAACLQWRRGALMNAGNRRSEAVAAFRAALQEASEHKSHIVEVYASQQLATTLITGHGGPRWSVAEVRGLLQSAKTVLAKCKWMPADMFAKLKATIATESGVVEAAAASSPGATMLLAEGCIEHIASPDLPMCSGCGQHSNTLKKCSNCGVAAYCSRACQVQHWKRGGHKQECEQLAAGSNSSGGAGSSRG